MTGAGDPGSVRVLQRRLTEAARAQTTTVSRLQSLVANVVVAQLLPSGPGLLPAVKGGTGLKLRLGDAMTRETPDLDTAFRGDRDRFFEELESAVAAGWGGFTGVLKEKRQRPPDGVPAPT